MGSTVDGIIAHGQAPRFHEHRNDLSGGAFRVVDNSLTSLERAFALAKSGCCADILELRHALKREGYSADYVVGRSLTQQLKALIDKARADKSA